MEVLTETMVAPKLRFREFDGEWEKQALGSLTVKVGNKNKDNIEYPIYSINNIEGFKPQSEQFDGLDSNIRGYDISIYKIVKPNTFAYNPARINVGSIGYSYDLENIIISSLYVCFKTDEELDDSYLRMYLKTYNFNKAILRYQEGGVRQYLFYENFSMIKVPLPAVISEQKKIATFLYSVDEKLQQLKRKKDLLEEYKKGVMQKIFCQDLRFRDENDNHYPDWEEKQLGEVFSFKQGIQCEIENQFFEWKEGLIRFIRIVDLTKKDEPIRYIKDPGLNQHISNDDLFMVRYGNAGLVGYGFSGVIANNLFRIIPRDITIIHNNFFHFIFKYKQRRFEMLASSSTMPALNFSSLKTLKLKLPSIEEQQKIANFLSAIDGKIELVNTQLENTQVFKKGLLQQMFV